MGGIDLLKLLKIVKDVRKLTCVQGNFFIRQIELRQFRNPANFIM